MAGKITYDEFAEFNKIIEGLKKMTESLKGITVNINEFKKNVPNIKDFQGLINGQAALTTEQKKYLASLRAIAQTEAAASRALSAKANAQKAATLATNAQIRQNKLLEQGTRKVGSAFSGLVKSLLAYGAAMFGINQIIRFFTNTLLEMTKKLDSLDFALKTVIKSSKELKDTKLFLSKVAKNYGHDLLVLTERYTKFRAATLQSNMTATDTRKIFDSVAKAAGVLGLKTDEVNGVFLALEQMISKGKVTTEELRRQLGERLPGAMGIMAKAMGVSISELDKMLKAGTVLSSEALPKFAIALEDAYGIESVNKINTLAAAQGRLKTSWVEFVDALKASNTYSKTLDLLSKIVNISRYSNKIRTTANDFELLTRGIDKMTSTTKTMLDYSIPGISGLVDYYSSFSEKAQGFIKLINEMEDAEKKGASNSKEYFISRVRELGFGLKRAENLWKEYNDSILEMDKKTSSEIFNYDEKIKEFEMAMEAAANFAKLEDNELKKYIQTTTEMMRWGKTTVDEIVTDQIRQSEQKLKIQELILKNAEDEYKNVSNIEEILYKSTGHFDKNRKLTKEELDLMAKQENAVNNINNLKKYLIYLKTLENKEDKKTEKIDLLGIAKLKNEIKLEEYKAELQKRKVSFASDVEKDPELRTEKEKNDALKEFESDLNTELILYKIELNKKLYKLTDDGSKERLELEKINAELLSDLQKEITDETIDNMKRDNDIRIENAKELSDKLIADTYNHVDDVLLAESYKYAELIKANKGNLHKIEELKDEYQEKQLDNEIYWLEALLQYHELFGGLTFEAEEDLTARLKALKKRRNEEDFDDAERTERRKLEMRQQYAEKTQQIINAGFDFASQIYDNQLDRAERVYELESAAAGESAEEKMAADNRYDKKKREIEKKQAILKKTQGAFNIIINTADAIMEYIAKDQPILAAAAGVLGGIQLGTVLAEPVPAYKEGSKGLPVEGGLSILGDADKQELVVEPSGKKWLSDSTAGLYDLNKGSIVYSGDETQNLLRNQTYKQSSTILGLAETNKYLKSIDKNTKNRSDTWFDDKYRYVKQGNITTRYALRGK